MLSFLPKSNNKKILDIGCGAGTISLILKNFGFDVVGIDFSKEGIKKAKEKGINSKVCDVDKEGLPFPSNYYDIIWAGDIIEHVFDPIYLIKEISRVIKPSGEVIISTPNALNLFMRLFIFITGSSPQIICYKRYRQCKHHTLMSWDLLNFFLKKGNLTITDFRAIMRIPYIKFQKPTKSKILGILFGRTFIIKAKCISSY